MSKNSSGWVGTLVTVGALGAMAGMLAWRFSQRHRMQRQSFYRDLSRWEGEGGSLAETAGDTGLGPQGLMAGASARRERGDAPRRGMTGATANAADGAGNGEGGASSAGAANGANGAPWPFPHS